MRAEKDIWSNGQQTPSRHPLEAPVQAVNRRSGNNCMPILFVQWSGYCITKPEACSANVLESLALGLVAKHLACKRDHRTELGADPTNSVPE